MKDFIEPRIIGAVRELLTGRGNELLGELQLQIPQIEFSEYQGGNVVVPGIALASCEQTEKERIIRQDAYFMSITFTLPESEDSEYHCYVYGAVVGKAIGENPTLGGVADRAVVTGKKYMQPNKPYCGDGWGIIVTLRVTVVNDE